MNDFHHVRLENSASTDQATARNSLSEEFSKISLKDYRELADNIRKEAAQHPISIKLADLAIYLGANTRDELSGEQKQMLVETEKAIARGDLSQLEEQAKDAAVSPENYLKFAGVVPHLQEDLARFGIEIQFEPQDGKPTLRLSLSGNNGSELVIDASGANSSHCGSKDGSDEVMAEIAKRFMKPFERIEHKH